MRCQEEEIGKSFDGSARLDTPPFDLGQKPVGRIRSGFLSAEKKRADAGPGLLRGRHRKKDTCQYGRVELAWPQQDLIFAAGGNIQRRVGGIGKGV